MESTQRITHGGLRVFVPFLGDFLSIFMTDDAHNAMVAEVFVPFLGDFLSMKKAVTRDN